MPRPELVEIVGEPEAVSRALAEHSRRVLMGEATNWASIAEQLASAARVCQAQVRRAASVGASVAERY